MKREGLITYLLAFLTLLAVVFYLNWQPTKEQNVFEEMYQQLSRGPNKTFANKFDGVVKYRNYREPLLEKNTYSYGVRNSKWDDKLPDELVRVYVLVRTRKPSQALTMQYEYKMDASLNLVVTFYYDEKHKQLTEDIRVKNGNQERLKEILASRQMTEKDLFRETRDRLNQFVIQPWLDDRSSRFSKKNWGKLTIKSPTILDGIMQ